MLDESGDGQGCEHDASGYQAGVYRDVLLRRWRNTLRRTMWDFPGGRTAGNRHLVPPDRRIG